MEKDDRGKKRIMRKRRGLGRKKDINEEGKEKRKKKERRRSRYEGRPDWKLNR